MTIDKIQAFCYGAIIALIAVMLMQEFAHGEITIRARVLVAEPLEPHIDMIYTAQETVTDRMAAAGVNLVTTRIDVVPDAAAEWNTLQGFWFKQTFLNWKRVAPRPRRRTVTIAYAPPLDGKYFSGMSWICSLGGGVGVAHINPDAEYAQTKAGIVAGHEIGQMLGAKPDCETKPATLMHNDARQHDFSAPVPELSDKSKAEIVDCVKRYRRRLRRIRWEMRRTNDE
jgi:hypothetical protein